MNERRRVEGTPKIERRTGGDSPGDYLVGYAAVFNQWTTLYQSKSWVWREKIRAGAFAAAISERQDVRSLFNHDPNFVLGRTTSGTLSLRETDKGLWSETRLADSPTIRDLVVTPIEREDVTGMSFGFNVRNDGGQTTIEKDDASRKVICKRSGEIIVEWIEGDCLYTERELLSVDLFDTSPVTYPAYKGTSVGLRSDDFARLEEEARRMFEESSRCQPRRDDAWIARASGILRLAEAG